MNDLVFIEFTDRSGIDYVLNFNEIIFIRPSSNGTRTTLRLTDKGYVYIDTPYIEFKRKLYFIKSYKL